MSVTAQTEETPKLLSIQQVAKFLGIGRDRAYRAVNEGQIPSIQLGSQKMVPREALERHLASAGK
jgi:excisionase family DNA binding protein